MNYIKKLKTIGFKRDIPYLVCTYSYIDKREGYYIVSALEVIKDIKGNLAQTQNYFHRLVFGQLSGGVDSSGRCLFQTYRFDASPEVKIYITILKDIYWAFIDNRLIPDEPYEYDPNIIHHKNVQMLVNGERLNPQFWSEIKASLSTDVLRMVNLNSILDN